jgi:hypothetical protein
MDLFILELSGKSSCDLKWVKSEVIDRNNGFDYSKHLRPMLCKIIGEHSVQVVEFRFEIDQPGDLEQLKLTLAQLWKVRCAFAHNDVATNVSTQAKFDAPSWTINQHRIISRRLESLRVLSLSLIDQIPKS